MKPITAYKYSSKSLFKDPRLNKTLFSAKVDNLDIIFNDKNRFHKARLSSLAEKLYLHAVINGKIAYDIYYKAENKLPFFFVV
jgi:hypothetical protein